jgi:hypothetical protein
MRFFRPSWGVFLPPLLLVLLAFVPSEAIRQLLFGLLAVPLQPAITQLGHSFYTSTAMTPSHLTKR